MAGKAGMIAAGIAGALAIGTGGYFANEWRVCSNLKQDYRAFAIGLLADQHISTAASSSELRQMMQQKADVEVDQAGRTLYELSNRCGPSAAAQAHADAQAMVLGIRGS
ncbi:hypothetical protein [Erythrobacter sp.]|uniref:hypothetical protein n=1 Tax=Erythrobacter sp. TaxID=1042 RepID=UPI0025E00695|nr:hypothetical protein [Erythrobacter sp.]